MNIEQLNTDTIALAGIGLVCFGGYQNPAAAIVAIGCGMIFASFAIGKAKVSDDVGD